MGFVALLESAEDRDGVFDVWFVNINGLETAFECGVLFDVLAVFVQCGGADAMQFAAGKGRFKQVRGVAAAFGRAGSDDGVKFVDEQYDLSGRSGDFF